MEDISLKKLFLTDPEEKEALAAYLNKNGLCLEGDADVAYGLLDAQGELLGCGCGAGSLLKCFAVEESLRGSNALGTLLSAIVGDRFSKGLTDLFVITRSKNEPLFRSCGFYTVVKTEALVMLENLPRGPESFASALWRPEDRGKVIGAAVMNCNPFTLGHRYLIEQACQCCDVLHVFLVEEDRSFFSTALRLRLLQEGTADLKQVRVHLGGPYMLSAATFPKYFLKETDDAALLQQQLDAELFAQRIAPPLHISLRFVGEEPLDGSTASYNETMKKVFPAYGITLKVFPRLMMEGLPVSASRVRALLKTPEGLNKALTLVPDATGTYFIDRYGKKEL